MRSLEVNAKKVEFSFDLGAEVPTISEGTSLKLGLRLSEPNDQRKLLIAYCGGSGSGEGRGSVNGRKKVPERRAGPGERKLKHGRAGNKNCYICNGLRDHVAANCPGYVCSR